MDVGIGGEETDIHVSVGGPGLLISPVIWRTQEEGGEGVSLCTTVTMAGAREILFYACLTGGQRDLLSHFSALLAGPLIGLSFQSYPPLFSSPSPKLGCSSLENQSLIQRIQQREN